MSRCPPAIQAAIAEMARRQLVLDRIENAAFDKQRAFVRDETHKQYLMCPRRAGKSVGDCLKLFRTGIKYDSVRCVYVGLTRGSAKKVLWDELKATATRLDIACEFREAELIVRLPNGSTIELVGMDADKNQRAKALGGKYKIIIIDEAASYRVDLGALMKAFFDPGTADQRGMIVMSGTPDPDEARGFFYDVSTGQVTGWASHTWDTLDNPYMREQWQERLDEILAEDPLYVETPEYKCMYKAEWPDDPSGWVYRFSRKPAANDNEYINLCELAEVPEIHQRVIAIDLGWNDDSAIVEACWNRHNRRLFITHAEKAPRLLFDALVARIRAVIAARPGVPYKLVIDGADKQSVEDMRSRFQLPLIATEKSDKTTFIRLMNTELMCGRIKVVRGAATPLLVEWSGADENGVSERDASPLVWDKRAMQRRPPRLVEDSRCANHAADAALYAFRYAWQFLCREETKDPEPGTPAAVKAEIERYKAKLRKQLREEEYEAA